MRRAVVVPIVLAALTWPVPAEAGGWASVSLDPRPDGASTGRPWLVDVTVMQHGRTPLPGVRPAILVTGPDGRRRRFPARPTAREGVYRASVQWSSPGRHTYEVDDGFTNAFPVDYPPVEVAAGAAVAPAHVPRPEPGFPWTLYLVSVGIMALVGGGLAVALRPGGSQARKLPRIPLAGPAAAPDPMSSATSSSP